MESSSWEVIPERIEKILRNKIKPNNTPFIIAIDGRCASGKSTLGAELSQRWNTDLFHMDDFYLRPEQRTPDRFTVPGGNIDHERFTEEVLNPLLKGDNFTYRPFLCQSMTFGSSISVIPGRIAIVEGSYACHPALRDHYDLRLFMTVDPEEQKQRILKRNGPEILKNFINRWIPLEEAYFSGCQVMERCDFTIDTTSH